MNKFLLKINEEEYIEMKFPSPFNEAFFMDIVKIKFYTKNCNYILNKEDALGVLRDEWINMLTKALKNELPLKRNLELGYELNQIFANKTLYNNDNNEYWWGFNYLLASGGDNKINTNSWLYNNKQGNIIFEITEQYFWHFKNNSKNKKYITYEKFIKNYKPLITRIIPHELAHQWLTQCKNLLKQIYKNELHQEKHRKREEQLHKDGKCKECNTKNISCY